MTSSTFVRRSDAMIEVAYFLAKYGEKESPDSPTKPPPEVGTSRWNAAYATFYRALGDGRTLSSFQNSLKNARDVFDARVDSGRIGWRQAGADRPPARLSNRNQRVFTEFENLKKSEVWGLIREYADARVATIPSKVLNDMAAQESGETDRKTRTEGGKTVYISYKRERDPALRSDALDIHGYNCAVCQFDFAKAYGRWGDGYAEVHHLIQLGGANSIERETDPLTDLTVLCANCHRMVHRKRGTALTIDELKAKLNVDYFAKWASGLSS